MLLELRDGWTLHPETAFEITETGLTRRSATGAQARPAEVGDWRAALGEAYSGSAVYEVEFEATDDQARRAVWLDLGDVRHVAEATVNGHPVGARAWQPWTYPVEGRLRTGRNHLRVVVGNTMANQYVHTKAMDRWQPNQLGPYHPTALKFEVESLPSGLYGPVVLRATRARTRL